MDPASCPPGNKSNDLSAVSENVGEVSREDRLKENQLVNDASHMRSSASTLSANAPPFQSSKQFTSGQLSASAKEFVPKAMITEASAYSEPYQGEVYEEYGEQQGESDSTDPLLEYAFQVLYEITYNPGQFSQLCDELLATLSSWPLDESVLQALVNQIIAQAANEPNFRYNGARLCNAISCGLSNVSHDFRPVLFNSCKLIHAERKNLVQSDGEYLRGFALFMSELFVHMSNKGGRFRVLGRAVRELLQTLLDHPTPGNIKCLCQILKLSGFYIEDDDRQCHDGKPVETDCLMANIDIVSRTVDMQMHIKDLLRGIIELRNNDWGQAPTPVSQETFQHHIPNTGQMGVFYGPDGQVMTAEETEFLDQGMSMSHRHGEEDEFDYPDEEDTGMDDEMAEAFEKFLMMQDTLK